jgi:ribosome-binding factor A
VSARIDQVESVLHRAVQDVITRGLNDPRVRGLISVTRVKVSPDLAHATVSVSVLPEEHAELSMHGLRHANHHIRAEVGKRVRMRRVPLLAFNLDKSLKKEAEVIAAINEARRADEQRAAARTPGPTEEPAREDQH